MTEIGECALYAIVTPLGIIPRHAEYQVGDLLRNARSTRPLPCICPLFFNKFAVSREQCIRCHQRLQFTKSPSPQQFGLHGQSHPLFVSEPKAPPLELLLEHTVLFDEIVDDVLLVPAEPADQGG